MREKIHSVLNVEMDLFFNELGRQLYFNAHENNKKPDGSYAKVTTEQLIELALEEVVEKYTDRIIGYNM